jgi:nucleoside phosphorylase
MMGDSSDQTERAAALADRVTFGILPALPKEYAAMKAMLDAPVACRAPGRGAAHDYELGEIPAKTGGTHVVAIAQGDQGNPNAAVHATTLLHDFPDVEALLMVGIAGGVPSPVKAETHVRLGDIVVSGEHGVVKYDFVKEHSKDRFEPRHPPRAPSAVLRHAARRLESSERNSRPWLQHIPSATHLNVAQPDAETDKLADTLEPAKWVEHSSLNGRLPCSGEHALAIGDPVRGGLETQLSTPEQKESDMLFPAVHGRFRSGSVLDKPFKDVTAEMCLNKHFTRVDSAGRSTTSRGPRTSPTS